MMNCYNVWLISSVPGFAYAVIVRENGRGFELAWNVHTKILLQILHVLLNARESTGHVTI